MRKILIGSAILLSSSLCVASGSIVCPNINCNGLLSTCKATDARFYVDPNQYQPDKNTFVGTAHPRSAFADLRDNQVGCRYEFVARQHLSPHPPINVTLVATINGRPDLSSKHWFQILPGLGSYTCELGDSEITTICPIIPN